jgi:hypothetical protein
MITQLLTKLDFDAEILSDWFSKISAAFFIGAFLTTENWLAAVSCVVFSVICLYVCQKLAKVARREKQSCSE